MSATAGRTSGVMAPMMGEGAGPDQGAAHSSEDALRDILERVVDFTRGADVLVADCTCTDEEYPARTGWGHSRVSEVADLAWRARVRDLYLFHHDPNHTDAVIDAKLEQARDLLHARGAATVVRAPVEYAEIEV